MKVSIQNLGRVKKASLDLSKKLTILTGQNNSGKTWISYLIYGIIEDFQDDFNLFDSNKIVEQLINEGEIHVDLEENILSRKEEINSQISTKVEGHLPYIFKADQNLFVNTKIKIDLVDCDLLGSLEDLEIHTSINYRDGISVVFRKSINETSLLIVLLGIGSNKNSLKSIDLEFLQYLLYDGFFKKISIGLIWLTLGQAYMMPAERIAINIFSKEMSLKRSKVFDDIRNLFITRNEDTTKVPEFLGKKSSRYAKPIHDALLIAEDLSELQTNESEFEWLAAELEQEILKGKVLVTQEGSFEFQPEHHESQKLGIHLTGSVVKTFVSLVFYFRHIAQEGDFIIIDEPEINLHPDNQVLLAKILAKISNAGFRLMISTHSEYLLKEFNFFLYMNKRRDVFEKFADKYGYSEDVLLNAEDINVFLLKEDGSFQDIKVEEDGFDIETIDDVINQQSQKAADIWGWS